MKTQTEVVRLKEMTHRVSTTLVYLVKIEYQPAPQMQNRFEGNKVYERKLPPNVEEMLRQKRQQLANQLSYQ